MPERLPRVNQLIKKELSLIVQKETECLNGPLVTLTRVETSSNLIQSKAYISVMPEDKAKKALQILNKNIYHIQQKINKKLNMRPVPKIIFIEETETAKAGKIEKILAKLKK